MKGEWRSHRVDGKSPRDLETDSPTVTVMAPRPVTQHRHTHNGDLDMDLDWCCLKHIVSPAGQWKLFFGQSSANHTHIPENAAVFVGSVLLLHDSRQSASWALTSTLSCRSGNQDACYRDSVLWGTGFCFQLPILLLENTYVFWGLQSSKVPVRIIQFQ